MRMNFAVFFIKYICRCVVEMQQPCQPLAKRTNSFEQRWLVHPSLKKWMEEKNGQAFCKFCATPVIGTMFHMLCHGESTDHMKQANSILTESPDAMDHSETLAYLDSPDEKVSDTPISISSFPQTKYVFVIIDR